MRRSRLNCMSYNCNAGEVLMCTGKTEPLTGEPRRTPFDGQQLAQCGERAEECGEGAEELQQWRSGSSCKASEHSTAVSEANPTTSNWRLISNRNNVQLVAAALFPALKTSVTTWKVSSRRHVPTNNGSDGHSYPPAGTHDRAP